MSQANAFGILPGQLIPGPDFEAGPDGSGKYTGSQTFTCRKFDFSTVAIQSKIARGTPAPVPYPNLGAEWNFLYVATARHEHQPGGITKIFVQYEGAATSGPEIQEDDRSIAYSLNASLTETDMMKHPKYAGITFTEKNAIAALLKGSGRQAGWGSDTAIIVIDNYSGEQIGTINSTEGLDLYHKVITNGQLTYLAPTVEWTQTKTNLGLISAEDLSDLGYVATPAGDYPVFTGRNWMMSGVSQEQTFTKAEEVKTWAKTWTLSAPGEVWNPFLYAKP